ncbi:hypothetical protein F5X71_07735 [Nocardia brasiliensis]|uniref:Uncharacterized protein n=1 Tax=Nocardia brasiliensis TaxID=37326 RepID=A0A6G9XMQ5_NOCBR|nr:hypothetical protein [Nocardia brasiliensis]QIS02221.1 hypothetical protein F5X71_07735 [Nocardia brasiliensis]
MSEKFFHTNPIRAIAVPLFGDPVRSRLDDLYAWAQFEARAITIGLDEAIDEATES